MTLVSLRGLCQGRYEGATQTDRQPFQGVTMSCTYLVRAAAATLIGAALLSAAVDTPAQASTRTEFTPTHTLGSGPLWRHRPRRG